MAGDSEQFDKRNAKSPRLRRIAHTLHDGGFSSEAMSLEDMADEQDESCARGEHVWVGGADGVKVLCDDCGVEREQFGDGDMRPERIPVLQANQFEPLAHVVNYGYVRDLARSLAEANGIIADFVARAAQGTRDRKAIASATAFDVGAWAQERIDAVIEHRDSDYQQGVYDARFSVDRVMGYPDYHRRENYMRGYRDGAVKEALIRLKDKLAQPEERAISRRCTCGMCPQGACCCGSAK